ncbi:type II secretion system F family protein [Bacillus massiliigorillae]|uniref:type II secretion system F family protein n=1 Tax=Bacillus massiliigorillae TaxID=1243664 RepID=UPI0003A5B0E6|nr:type II secretion system F family protein [Bacillus massiliigorillae]
MAKFSYKGRDLKGKKAGQISASSKREAVVKLSQTGIKVQFIEEIPETLFTKDLSFGRKVKLKHFVIFLRQFSTLLKAGVTMVDATRILGQQTENKHLRNALLDIEQELKEGNPLSLACSKHKKIFTPIFINMVRAGEAGGNLDDTLDRLAVQYEKQHDMQKKITAALTYPVIVGIMAIVVLIFLLIAIVPTFVDLFAEFGGELPTITKFVLKASDFMQNAWYVIVLFIFAIIALIITLKKNKATKYYFDYFLLKIPVIGKMLQKASLAKFTRTFSSLFSSSVPVLQAMAIVEEVVGNEVIAGVIKKSRNSLEKGQSITGPMVSHWAFPPLVTQMIVIGEETGSLDSMLTKVADFYEKEVEYSTDQIKTLIEPIMILLLAVIVGTIVASILIPMFQIFNQVGTY